MLLKDAVSYYANNDSSVYCVLLDATNAFDTVQYFQLFEILIDRFLPASVNRLLFNMYLEQKTQVNWNSMSTELFVVLNGVKQGGIDLETLRVVRNMLWAVGHYCINFFYLHCCLC